MRTHYTTFEGKEQFDLLRDKASQLAGVSSYYDRETFFGFDRMDGRYVSYDLTGYDVIGYYQGATYLPYTEYITYLDNCIKERDGK